MSFRRIRKAIIGLTLLVSVSSLGGISAAAPSEIRPHSPALQATTPQLGISFFSDGDGQCDGTGQQWTAVSNWTTAIRFDTDNRSGGCRLAFGVQDVNNALQGLALSFKWEPGPEGDTGECGDLGTYSIPINTGQSFSPSIRIDTDERPASCKLSFYVDGRTDIGLDVLFYADGDAGQCRQLTYPGNARVHTARSGSPVYLGLDMDGRWGGCVFALRLTTLSASPSPSPTPRPTPPPPECIIPC